jgi:hypothetical protein
VETLRNLGCLEFREGDVHARRRQIIDNPQGKALLAAIDAFDQACMRGAEKEIRSTGAALVAMWGELKSTALGKVAA